MSNNKRWDEQNTREAQLIEATRLHAQALLDIGRELETSIDGHFGVEPILSDWPMGWAVTAVFHEAERRGLRSGPTSVRDPKDRLSAIGLLSASRGHFYGSWPLDDTADVHGPDKLPAKGRAVVYFLFLHDVVYIGSTDDLRCRLGQHAKDKVFESWEAFGYDNRRLAYMVEEILLKDNLPPLNRTSDVAAAHR